MGVSSNEDSAGDLCYAESFFEMKFIGFMSKAIKLLLTELGGSVLEYIALSLFRIDLPSVGQYGKGCG